MALWALGIGGRNYFLDYLYKFPWLMADDEKKEDRGFDSYIPVWDGRSDRLRDLNCSVTWWPGSIELKKTTDFNLAARLAMRQKGSAECPGPPIGQPSGQGHGGGQGQRPMPKFSKPLKKPTVGSVGKSTSYKPAEGKVVESNVVDLLPAEVAFTEAAFGVRLDDLPEIHG